MKKRLIVVVNGYGCHLDTPLGSVYLPKVKKYLSDHCDDVIAIVFSGGFTQKSSAPGVSEAVLMAREISPYLHLPIFEGHKIRLIVEEDAYSSYENSKKSADCIAKLLAEIPIGEDERLHIAHFCEAHRAPVVNFYDRHFMLKFVESVDDLTVETASWERADPMLQARNLVLAQTMIDSPHFAEYDGRYRREVAEAA